MNKARKPAPKISKEPDSAALSVDDLIAMVAGLNIRLAALETRLGVPTRKPKVKKA